MFPLLPMFEWSQSRVSDPKLWAVLISPAWSSRAVFWAHGLYPPMFVCVRTVPSTGVSKESDKVKKEKTALENTQSLSKEKTRRTRGLPGCPCSGLGPLPFSSNLLWKIHCLKEENLIYFGEGRACHRNGVERAGVPQTAHWHRPAKAVCLSSDTPKAFVTRPLPPKAESLGICPRE